MNNNRLSLVNPKRTVSVFKEQCQNDYDAIITYCSTSDSKLSPEQRKILERWIEALRLLKKYAVKRIVVNMLSVTYPDVSKKRLWADIAHVVKFWNITDPIDREFIEKFFVEKLMVDIADPDANPIAKSKNYATLQKYLASLPQTTLDPKHLEKNDIFIQVNINGNTVNLPEAMLAQIPKNVREYITGYNAEITEEISAEILDS